MKKKQGDCLQKIIQSNILIVIGISMVLLAVFAYTLASILATAPSEGISREVKLADLDYEGNNLIKSHVTTVVKNGTSVTTIVIDGERVKLITSDVYGQVIDSAYVAIDLSASSEMTAAYLDEDTLLVYSVQGDLYKVVIDTTTYNYEQALVLEDVDKVISREIGLIFAREDGLYGYNEGGEPVQILNQEIESFTATVYENQWQLIYTYVADYKVHVERKVFDKAFNEVESHSFGETLENDYYKKLQDVFIENDVMTSLFLLTNNRYKTNYISAVQVDLSSNNLMSIAQVQMPILRSKFRIIDVEQGETKFVMQYPENGEINIANVVMSDSGPMKLIQLTKTKTYSQLSEQFKLQGEIGIVFVDRSQAKWQIKYVTSQADVIEATTKASTIGWAKIVSTTLFAALVGGVIGLMPFVFIAGIVPFLVSIALKKILPKEKATSNLSLIIPAILSLLLQMGMTYYQIHVMRTLTMRPIFIGGEPMIYLVLTVLSILSYWLLKRTIRNTGGYGILASLPYAVYVLYGWLFYTMLIFIYLSTEFVIGKI